MKAELDFSEPSAGETAFGRSFCLRPDLVDGAAAEQDARAFARAEQDRLEARSLKA
jgi:hypothetical protein